LEKHDAISAVAIVILSWNQRSTTLQCLRSLVDAGYDLGRVVLWDNGSDDGTMAAIAENFPIVIRHRSERNLGVASGRNAAAQLAIERLHPDFILFLDNDMSFTPAFVEALLAPLLRDGNVAQTTAKILTHDDGARINAAGGSAVNFATGTIVPVGYGEIDSGQYDAPRPCLPGGGGTMVRTDLFLRFSGFDPIFDPYGPEDLDFSFRIRRAGYAALYVPEAVIYHDHHRTVNDGEFDESYTNNKLRHWIILLRRHATPWQKIAFFLVGGPVGAFRIILRELSQGNTGAIKGLLAGIRSHWIRPSAR
jgi:GT2 family glycosyltransferase